MAHVLNAIMATIAPTVATVRPPQDCSRLQVVDCTSVEVVDVSRIPILGLYIHGRFLENHGLPRDIVDSS